MLMKLTQPQQNMLALLNGAVPDGIKAAERLPVLVALEARGLAERRGTRAVTRILRWHITAAGVAWLQERRAAELAEER